MIIKKNRGNSKIFKLGLKMSSQTLKMIRIAVVRGQVGAETAVSSEGQLAKTSKQQVKKVTHRKSRYLITRTSATKSIIKRQPILLRSSESSSDELSLGGSSDSYQPSSEDNDSSSSGTDTPSTTRSADSSSGNFIETTCPTNKPKKRLRDVNNWGKVKSKRLKNSGQAYKSRTGKMIDARKMGPPCSDKCILSCTENISQDYRSQLFADYWAMGSFQRQRDYLNSCIETLILKYRCVSAEEPRKPNCAFYIKKNEQKNRLCKTFLINTLGITERRIRTVIQGKTTTGMAPIDNREKHSNHHKTDPGVLASVRNHINSIPRIESHYVRSDTSREFIDGGLTISEMHRHYSSQRTITNLQAANYDTYSRIFNTEFNIGFFLPKKDQCDICEGYKNATGEEKTMLGEKYQRHQEEKTLSREEKSIDKQMAQRGEIHLAVYDLQAVLPVPMGQSSAFFYKSRLNCYNFTVSIRVN